MPVSEMFAALIEMKYKGYVDLEYEVHPDDPMPGVIAVSHICAGSCRGWGT